MPSTSPIGSWTAAPRMAAPTWAADAHEAGQRPWRPQPGPQTLFVDSPTFEVVYGGARGGGKTDAALGDFACHARRYGAGARGLLVRRTRRALEPTVKRARAIFAPEGAAWNAGRSAFEWPSGAVLWFRHLDNDADADLYQGHSHSRVYVEELTQFPSPIPVDKLKATLRSPEGVPVGFRATCNPGGAGHAWVKGRYVDAGPPKSVIEETFADPFTGERRSLRRQFIPARLADNPALALSDPDYVSRLMRCGSKSLVRAWLEGDWSVIEGAFFDQWSEARNVVPAFPVPEPWTRLRSFDWGYAAPFSVGWWALAQDDRPLADGRTIPRGALVRYREWYGAGPDGRGLRLTAETVAAGIREREAREGVIPLAVADPSIFAQNGGPSIGERMARCGVRWRAADNTRVGALGALSGWDQVRARIAGQEGVPRLFVFDTCADFIRTVPCLQHDRDRPEDLDTDTEDHIADETRYACLARPWFARPPDPRRDADEAWEREWGPRPPRLAATGWPQRGGANPITLKGELVGRRF